MSQYSIVIYYALVQYNSHSNIMIVIVRQRMPLLRAYRYKYSYSRAKISSGWTYDAQTTQECAVDHLPAPES